MIVEYIKFSLIIANGVAMAMERGGEGILVPISVSLGDINLPPQLVLIIGITKNLHPFLAKENLFSVLVNINFNFFLYFNK